jgi:hypothetical protein
VATAELERRRNESARPQRLRCLADEVFTVDREGVRDLVRRVQ